MRARAAVLPGPSRLRPIRRVPLVPALLPVLVLAFAACRGAGTDPSRWIPADAGAFAVIRSASDLGARAARLFERLPEAAGAADLLRSATGLDLRSPEGTAEQGLDPRRPAAVAAWRGAAWVVLPASDRDVASRRLGLRLARLGFVEDAGTAGGKARSFHDVRDASRVARLRVAGDVVIACVGPATGCAGIDGLSLLAPGAGIGEAARAAAIEAGMPDADLAVVVRTNALLAAAKEAFRVQVPGGAAGIMVRAALGDLRLAASLDGGVVVRAVLGPSGDPLPPPDEPQAPPEGVLVRADLSLAALPEGVTKMLQDACGAPCRADGPGDPAVLLAAWDGRATAALVASRTPDAAPVDGVRAFLRRAAVVVALGVRAPDGAATGLSVAASQATLLGVPLLPGAERDPETVAGRAPDGLEAAAAARGGVLAVAVGRGAEAAVRDLALGRRADLPGAPPVLATGVVLRVAADPNGWIEALGGLGVEFVRHVVSSVRVVGVEAALRDGRFVVDGSVRLR